MKIEFVELQNFRRLKSCRIDFSQTTTLFVGANNSGKTSATDALVLFLYDKSKLSIRDFTLSNRIEINKIGASLREQTELNIEEWRKYLPSIDIWLQVEQNEIHHVSHLIPTLDWEGGLLGIRLIIEPKNLEDLHRDFCEFYEAAEKTRQRVEKSTKSKDDMPSIWPTCMWDFIDRALHNQFQINSYLLDYAKLKNPEDGIAIPQTLGEQNYPLEEPPFNGLVKIDIINAQRGFTDVNTNTNDINSSRKMIGNLSSQLREYYRKHLDPDNQPEDADIDVLAAINGAQTIFDGKLKERFSKSLKELEELNYPGFGNPSITLSSKINPIDGINHESGVLYDISQKDDDSDELPLQLPEKYNGLGYQNLISMVFKLIRFRDEWMQVGKVGKSNKSNKGFEPLHLVIIEEPEAHLHAQVQQVFVRKAYDVLRKHQNLKKNKSFSTQLVISTHSNHIAHEVDFKNIRYFKRRPGKTIPISTVVNLSETFGNKNENDTTKFAIRYLKTTHCDLFFADAVILMEGSAERMLVPHFIRNEYFDLVPAYISLLEIGGSHAHRLKPLIEDLGIITLIITDIDSMDPKNNRKSVQPKQKKGYKTSNGTLKEWLPKEDSIDKLLNLVEDGKISKNKQVRVTYQTTIKNGEKSINPYTFEDALVLSNRSIFKNIKGTGLIGQIQTLLIETDDQDDISEQLYEIIKNTKEKGKFALDLLFIENSEQLKAPDYIKEGLQWLQKKLENQRTN